MKKSTNRVTAVLAIAGMLVLNGMGMAEEAIVGGLKLGRDEKRNGASEMGLQRPPESDDLNLISPTDGSVWNVDSSGSQVTFIWDRNSLPNPAFNQYFVLNVVADISRWDTTRILRRDSVMYRENLLDTSFTGDFSCFEGDYGMGRVPIEWTVLAIFDGDRLDTITSEHPGTFTLITTPPPNHPPSHFGLMSPRNGLMQDVPVDSATLRFNWRRSVDLDSLAEVHYDLVITAGLVWPDFPWEHWKDSTVSVTHIADTTAEYNFADLSRYASAGGWLPFNWEVLAISENDTARCDAAFECTLIFNYDGVSEGSELTPRTLAIEPPYPNPFNSTTTIRYRMDKPGRATIAVYDVTGKPVKVLQDEVLGGGWHDAVWKADGMGAGVYFVRLDAGGGNEVRKVVLVR